LLALRRAERRPGRVFAREPAALSLVLGGGADKLVQMYTPLFFLFSSYTCFFSEALYLHLNKILWEQSVLYLRLS
jgi:hypothetical protein